MVNYSQYQPEWSQALASKVTGPFYAAHRGGGSAQGGGNNYQGPFPEEFTEGFRASAAAGSACLNVHVRMTADGALVCMHDSTPDRTTNATGSINVASYTAQGWRQLTSTASTWTGYAESWGTIYPPFLHDVVREFGGKLLLMIEADSAGTTAQPTGTVGAAVTALLQAAGLTKCAIITSFQAGELTAAATAGIQTMYFPPNFGSAGYLPSDIAATMAAGWGAGLPKNVGINYAGGSQVQITGYIPTLAAARFTTWAWTPIRRSDVAWLNTAGCNLIITDEPQYVAASAPLDKSGQDPFTVPVAPTWPAGALPASNIANGRGTLTANGVQLSFVNSGGSQTYYHQSHGFLFPIAAAAGTYTITTTIKWDTSDSDSTRWASLYLCCADDAATTGLSGAWVNGYQLLFRQSGQVQLFRNTAPSTQAQVGSNQSTQAVNQGDSVVLSVQVTPAAIAVTPTVAGTGYGPFTFTDATYRGGYFQIGKAHSAVAPKLLVSFGSTAVT